MRTLLSKHNIFSLQGILVILTFVLCLFPLLPFRIVTLVSIIWSLLGFATYISSPKKMSSKEFVVLLFFITPVSLMAVSMIYSADFDAGLFELEKKTSLFVFPIIVFLNKEVYHAKLTTAYFTFFSIIIISYGLVINTVFILQMINYVDTHETSSSLVDIFSMPNFVDIYRHQIVSISGTHAPYLGLYFGIASVPIVSLLFKETKPYVKLLCLTAIGICFLFIAMLGSRSALIAMVIVFLFLALVNIESAKTRLITVVGTLAIGVFSLIMVPNLRNRVSEVFETEVSLDQLDDHNSTNVRYAIYWSSFEVIKENWILGVGIGDMQAQLNAKYKTLNAPVLLEQTFNTHNSFLNFWGSAGLLAFILLCGMLIYTFVLALQNHNFIYCAFILLCGITALTENILSRQAGVLSFAIFGPLLFIGLGGIESLKKEKLTSRSRNTSQENM